MIETWRLVISEATDGPRNMAVDEAILNLVGEGTSPPTLRFYRWQNPWVSLGSGQVSRDLDRSKVEASGWQIVRRSSGGTAVLHDGQLGYSLVLPANHRIWDGDLVASYERLADPLQQSLARLGAKTEQATVAQRTELKAATPMLAERVCFAALGPHELVAKGRKVVGNSQIRRRFASSQHGVIQVTGGQEALSGVLAGATDAECATVREFLEARVGSLAAATHRRVCVSEICESLIRSITEAFEIELTPGELSADECRLADDLVSAKYANPSWTFRR